MTTTKLPKMSEAQLQDAVVELAQLLGWEVAHFRPARTTDGWRTAVSADGKGFPDLTLVRDRVIFAELKSDIGKLSPDQDRWAACISDAGCQHEVWRPEQWRSGEIEFVLRWMTPGWNPMGVR